MKQIKISDALYKKLSDASAVVGQSTERTAREFIEESADAVLQGNIIEVEDLETFERLKKQAEKQAQKQAEKAEQKK